MLSPPPSKGVRRDWGAIAGNRGDGKEKSFVTKARRWSAVTQRGSGVG